MKKELLQYIAALLVFLGLFVAADVRSQLKFRRQYIEHMKEYEELIYRSGTNLNRLIQDLERRGAEIRSSDEAKDYIKILQADVDGYSGILRNLAAINPPYDLVEKHEKLSEIFRAQSSVEIMLVHYIKSGDRRIFEEAIRLFDKYKEVRVELK